MPNPRKVATTVADVFLPGIFRRPNPRQIPIGNDLPEDGGFTGSYGRQNLLMPLENPLKRPVVDNALTAVDGTRPRTVSTPTPVPVVQEPAPQPNVLAPEAAVETPSVSRSGQIMDENAIRERRVETNSKGRPTPNIALEGDDQTLDYYNRVARMPEDKEGGGWWPRIRTALLGFARGGPVGAATAFGVRALREKMDPTLASREYRREKLAELEPAVDAIQKQRKESRADEVAQAQIDLAKQRTENLKNPKQNQRIIKGKDGYYMLNPKSSKFEKIEEIPVAEPNAPSSTRYFKTKDGVWKIDATNPEGVRVKNIPGDPGKAGADVDFANSQINRAIKDAQAEQAKIDAALNGDPARGVKGVPQTIESTSVFGDKRTIANPEYVRGMRRRQQLDDQIRKWRIQLKKKGTVAAAAAPDEADDADPLGILDNEDEDEQ